MSNISIRALKDKDIPAMTEIAKDPDIQKMTLFVRAQERDQSIENVFEKLIEAQEKGWYLSYAVLENDRPVGYAMSLAYADAANTYWLGVWTDANERGKDIATKALQLVIDNTRGWDLEEGVTSIFKAAVADTNKASLRMMEKLGFKEIQTDANAPDAANPMHHFILE